MKLLKVSFLVLSLHLMSFTLHQKITVHPSAVVLNSGISIQWKNDELDLGDIVQSKPVSVDFEFKNNGDVPVIIESVQASCGCTSANYSKTPVLPGETTKISAIYNAAVKGSFRKTITVMTNADKMAKILTIKGVVI